MAGEVILVCTPISYLVGEVSPDDSIFIERQLDDVHLIVEVPDGLDGNDHAEQEEQQESEAGYFRSEPILRDDGES